MGNPNPCLSSQCVFKSKSRFRFPRMNALEERVCQEKKNNIIPVWKGLGKFVILMRQYLTQLLTQGRVHANQRKHVNKRSLTESSKAPFVLKHCNLSRIIHAKSELLWHYLCASLLS